MEWVKTTAKTLPEAIDLALDNLGVDESEAEIVVLEEPRAGLFGRTRGTARVEARVKPKPIRPKNERNRNRRNRSDDGSRNRGRKKGRRDGGGDGQSGQGENRGGRGDRGRDRAGDQRKRSGGGQGSTGGDRSAAGAGSSTDQRSAEGRSDGGESRGQGGSSGNRKRRRRRGGKGGGGQARTQGQARDGEKDSVGGSGSSRGRGEQGASEKRGPTSSGSNGGEAKPSEGAAVEEVATHVQTFLTDLIEAFGLDGDVTIDDSEEGTVIGRIEGRHGLLVGPKGRTLDAVQELARISCQRSAPNNVRIKIDVGGYRAQRAAALAEFAAKAADRAVSEGVEVTLEPMSPADRKSVHDALNGHGRVETRSVGAEPRRRVVVVPLDGGGESDDEARDDEDGGDERNGVSEAAVDDGLSEVEDGHDDRVRGDDEE